MHRRSRTSSPWTATVIAAALACPAAAAETAGTPRVVAGPTEIRIVDGERLILCYLIEPVRTPPGIDPACGRSGILHPVCSPRGTPVTGAVPRDHPHQSGIFTAWTNASYEDRRVDFWNLAKRQGRVLHATLRGTFATGNGAGFEVDLLHRIEGPAPVDVLRETWRVTARPTDGSHHCFDLETVQRAIAPAPVSLAKYHYGGLGVRGPESWLLPTDADLGAAPGLAPAGAEIVNSDGQDRLAGNLAHARWVAMASRPPAAAACIAALVHPSSFRAPQAARLHPTKPYFSLAPCADGPFVIDAASPFAARYRFLVTDGPADPAWIEAAWQSWVDAAAP